MKFSLIEYSLLRNSFDQRPKWAIDIGLYEFSLNGNSIKRAFPRLHFKRKLGSHVANPKADSSYIKEQESKYQSYFHKLIENN
jgi:hypothetical protein